MHREEGPEEAPYVSPQACALFAWGVPAVHALLGWLARVSRGPRATVSTPWDHSLWDSCRMERWTDRQRRRKPLS